MRTFLALCVIICGLNLSVALYIPMTSWPSDYDYDLFDLTNKYDHYDSYEDQKFISTLLGENDDEISKNDSKDSSEKESVSNDDDDDEQIDVNNDLEQKKIDDILLFIKNLDLGKDRENVDEHNLDGNTNSPVLNSSEELTTIDWFNGGQGSVNENNNESEERNANDDANSIEVDVDDIKSVSFGGSTSSSAEENKEYDDSNKIFREDLYGFYTSLIKANSDVNNNNESGSANIENNDNNDYDNDESHMKDANDNENLFEIDIAVTSSSSEESNEEDDYDIKIFREIDELLNSFKKANDEVNNNNDKDSENTENNDNDDNDNIESQTNDDENITEVDVDDNKSISLGGSTSSSSSDEENEEEEIAKILQDIDEKYRDFQKINDDDEWRTKTFEEKMKALFDIEDESESDIKDDVANNNDINNDNNNKNEATDNDPIIKFNFVAINDDKPEDDVSNTGVDSNIIPSQYFYNILFKPFDFQNVNTYENPKDAYEIINSNKQNQDEQKIFEFKPFSTYNLIEKLSNNNEKYLSIFKPKNPQSIINNKIMDNIVDYNKISSDISSLTNTLIQKEQALTGDFLRATADDQGMDMHRFEDNVNEITSTLDHLKQNTKRLNNMIPILYVNNLFREVLGNKED